MGETMSMRERECSSTKYKDKSRLNGGEHLQAGNLTVRGLKIRSKEISESKIFYIEPTVLFQANPS